MINGAISWVTILITDVREPITPLITADRPPSKGFTRFNARL